MLACPRRCVRRMPPVSYRCAFGRSRCSLRRRSKATPRVAADASAIRIDRIAGHGVLRPVASAAIRLRDVAPQVEGRKIREHLIAMVPLVRDDLVNHPHVSSSVTAATASKSSAAAVSVSATVVVSP